MFIQTESTPNPNSLKFILDDYELCESPVEFNKSQEYTHSLLADELFKIKGVENILFNKNCISVNKNEYTWDQLKASILQAISNHINSGLPFIEKEESNKSIKFLGFKKNIFSYLKNTDLYINTSYFEGFPNSVVEAAYCGVPIISSQSHGGINEILSNGKGGVIYQNGPDELATEIKKFFFNKSILRKKAIYAKKNSFKFNLLNHKKKFEKIITKI